MFVSIWSMIVAALTEIRRIKAERDNGLIDMPNAIIPLSIFLLLPRYVLFGIADVLTMVTAEIECKSGQGDLLFYPNPRFFFPNAPRRKFKGREQWGVLLYEGNHCKSMRHKLKGRENYFISYGDLATAFVDRVRDCRGKWRRSFKTNNYTGSFKSHIKQQLF